MCRLHTLSSGAGNRRESVEYDYFLILFYCKTRTTVQTVQSTDCTETGPLAGFTLLKGFLNSGAVESHKGRKKGGTRMYGKLLAAGDGFGLWPRFLILWAKKTFNAIFGHLCVQ